MASKNIENFSQFTHFLAIFASIFISWTVTELSETTLIGTPQPTDAPIRPFTATGKMLIVWSLFVLTLVG